MLGGPGANFPVCTKGTLLCSNIDKTTSTSGAGPSTEGKCVTNAAKAGGSIFKISLSDFVVPVSPSKGAGEAGITEFEATGSSGTVVLGSNAASCLCLGS
ncbi:hypothetical protein MKW94_013008 [Papaver nudicaule]|uniref:Uncharacterized protein n=1 Tax=Papaver nudicaule TaxID=74823 RepID=A0AA41UZ35_PAPNU|nr:hypothetical protein [Papaver nudicaule]